MLELVEMEMRELLSFYDFDGDNTPIIRGSALGALNGVPPWEDKIMELMEAVDTWIPLPPRDIDKPFLMPVEDVFSITGRGTVATGRIETGVIHVGGQLEWKCRPAPSPSIRPVSRVPSPSAMELVLNWSAFSTSLSGE